MRYGYAPAWLWDMFMTVGMALTWFMRRLMLVMGLIRCCVLIYLLFVPHLPMAGFWQTPILAKRMQLYCVRFVTL